MKRLTLALAFTILCFQQSALANSQEAVIDESASCEETPAAELEQNYKNIPYWWDQHDTQFCYGFAAAFLINHHLHRSDSFDGRYVDPLALSTQTILRTKNEPVKDTIWGGFIHHVLTTYQQGLACRVNENILHSQELSLKDILTTFKSIYVQHKKQPSDENVQKIQDIFQKLKLDLALSPTRAELDLWVKDISSNFTVNIMDRFCEKEPFASVPQWKQIERKNHSRALEIDLNQLLQQKTPVGINFCSDVVTNPKYTRSSYNEVCNKHYAVAVAQRKNAAGKCEVLMADSQCAKYNQISPGRCHKGLLWIQRSVLFNTLEDITWVN